jgi:PAS domain S-box-containing protein
VANSRITKQESRPDAGGVLPYEPVLEGVAEVDEHFASIPADFVDEGLRSSLKSESIFPQARRERTMRSSPAADSSGPRPDDRPGVVPPRPSILIVDEDLNRRLALESLLAADADVATADSVGAAARAVREREFAVFVADERLCGELLPRLHGQGLARYTRVVSLSAPELADGRVVRDRVLALARVREENRSFARDVRASGDKVRTLIERMPTTVWTVSRDLTITSCAGAWFLQEGRGPDAWIGRSIVEWLPPAANGTENPGTRAHREALEGRPALYQREIGGCAYEVRVEPIPGPDGPVGAVAAAFDVTSLKRAQSRERFLSEAGRLLSGSLRPEERLRDVARLAVPAIADACTIDLVDVNGDSRRLAAQGLGGGLEPDASAPGIVLSTGEPAVGTSALFVPLKARGRAIGVLGLISAPGGRRYEEDDLRMAEDLAQHIAYSVDNARLFRAAQQLAAIVESADDAVYTKDLDGNVTSWNPGAQRIFGFRPADIVGRSIMMLVPEGLHGDELGILDRIGRGEKVEHYETRRLRNDGSEIEISITVSPLRDPSGRVVGASTISRDVTARRRSEIEIRRLNEDLERRVRERTAQLEKTIQELNTFAYSVAHDLRAPLRSMAGFGTLLMEEFGEALGPDGRDYVRRINQAVGRMDRLTHELLGYERLSRDQVPISDVDLDELFADVLRDLGQEISERRALVLQEGPLGLARGNGLVLRQVLSNLIGNAIKFVAPGVRAQVRISASEEGGRVRVCIRDNGIGIEAQYLEKIFGLFERLHTQEVYPGTGVGLAIAKRAVERCGGQVGVESTPQAGSTFWFELWRPGSNR